MLLPTDATLRTLFATARTIAIIGAKDVPGQPVDRVGRYLMEAGYTVIPVHPKRKTVWGLPAVPRIDLVEQADIVNVFRAPQYCPDHAREVLNIEDAELLKKIQRSIKRLCSKAKAEAEAAAAKAEKAARKAEAKANAPSMRERFTNFFTSEDKKDKTEKKDKDLKK